MAVDAERCLPRRAANTLETTVDDSRLDRRGHVDAVDSVIADHLVVGWDLGVWFVGQPAAERR